MKNSLFVQEIAIYISRTSLLTCQREINRKKDMRQYIKFNNSSCQNIQTFILVKRIESDFLMYGKDYSIENVWWYMQRYKTMHIRYNETGKNKFEILNMFNKYFCLFYLIKKYILVMPAFIIRKLYFLI